MVRLIEVETDDGYTVTCKVIEEDDECVHVITLIPNTTNCYTFSDRKTYALNRVVEDYGDVEVEDIGLYKKGEREGEFKRTLKNKIIELQSIDMDRPVICKVLEDLDDELLVSFLRKHPSNFYIFTEGAHAVPTSQLLSVYNVDELEDTGEYYVAGETPFKFFQKVDSLSDEDYVESSESESESMSLEDEDET